MTANETITPRRRSSSLKAGRHPPPGLSVELSDDVTESPSLWSMSKRKKVTLFCLLLGALQAFLCLSLLAPFYPGEAQSRGVSQFVSGWVFSVYALTSFVTAPFFGKEIPIMGAKFLYILGAAVCGICTILFGFLGLFPRDNGYELFIAFSFLIRIVMALGSTAWFTCGFAIAMKEFRGNAATVMGLLETAVGVGLMVGPAVGGVLFEAGGFHVPFLVIGCLVLAGLPVYWFTLESTKELQKPGALLPLLRTPSVIVMCVAIGTAAAMLISLDPILELHLKQFGLSASSVGFVFLLCSGVYAVASPLVGALVDKTSTSSPFLMFGFFVMCVSFLFLGPSPLFGLDKYQHLWLNLTAISVFGIAAAFAVVPTYHRMMSCISLYGLEDSLATHGAMSGLWTSAYSLGETVGPVLSGWLTEDVGFPWATTVLACLGGVMAVVLLVELAIERFGRHKRERASTMSNQLLTD